LTSPASPLFPYTTLFRSVGVAAVDHRVAGLQQAVQLLEGAVDDRGRDHEPHHARSMQSGHEVAQGRRRTCLSQGTRRLLVAVVRSEEHTSELQSRENLVC